MRIYNLEHGDAKFRQHCCLYKQHRCLYNQQWRLYNQQCCLKKGRRGKRFCLPMPAIFVGLLYQFGQVGLDEAVVAEQRIIDDRHVGVCKAFRDDIIVTATWSTSCRVGKDIS